MCRPYQRLGQTVRSCHPAEGRTTRPPPRGRRHVLVTSLVRIGSNKSARYAAPRRGDQCVRRSAWASLTRASSWSNAATCGNSAAGSGGCTRPRPARLEEHRVVQAAPTGRSFAAAIPGRTATRNSAAARPRPASMVWWAVHGAARHPELAPGGTIDDCHRERRTRAACLRARIRTSRRARPPGHCPETLPARSG